MTTEDECGQLFTGAGRIVGPEYSAQKLADTLDDLTMQVTFVDDASIESVAIYTRASMLEVGVDHPVIVMPTSLRETWMADPLTPKHLLNEYEGALPALKRRASFEIVRPGDRRG
ncbi:MAG: hypothetical protein ABIP33_06370 [Pseudolysinimonas sp.]